MIDVFAVEKPWGCKGFCRQGAGPTWEDASKIGYREHRSR